MYIFYYDGVFVGDAFQTVHIHTSRSVLVQLYIILYYMPHVSVCMFVNM